MPQPTMCEYFSIADQILKVTSCDLTLEWGGILDAFRVAPQPWDHGLELRRVETLSAPQGELCFSDGGRLVYENGQETLRYIGPVERGWQDAMLRISRCGENSMVEFRLEENRITDNMLLQAMEITHRVAAAGAFLIHASHIAWQGKSILFTAPSGGGKTTQAELWQKHRNARIINGDRAIVLPGEEGCFALGVPYGGSSGIAKPHKQPLAAIVYVKQAPENRISRLTGLDAFRHVWEGCSLDTWCRVDVAACTDGVLSALEQTPVYLLECTPDAGAVLALEGVLPL